jgi:hypothetical protein
MFWQIATAVILGALPLAEATACETVTAQQLADALNKAPGLQGGLQSCAMAAMGMIESGGGNTCAHNDCCVGILQLNVSSGGLNADPG